MADPLLLSHMHYMPQSQILVENSGSFAAGIRSGGVCTISNKYDLIFYAVKNKLCWTRLAQIERGENGYWDGCEDVHEIMGGDVSSINFPDDIVHLSLSTSERYLCVCYTNTFSICDAKKITLKVCPPGYPHYSYVTLQTAQSRSICL